MKHVCALIGKYFGIIAIIFLILGLTTPTSFSWVMGKFLGVPVLSLFLGIIMFGMGTTLNLSDFALILKQPKNIFFGILTQYFVIKWWPYPLRWVCRIPLGNGPCQGSLRIYAFSRRTRSRIQCLA